jgi:hypothetical protein
MERFSTKSARKEISRVAKRAAEVAHLFEE